MRHGAEADDSGKPEASHHLEEKSQERGMAYLFALRSMETLLFGYAILNIESLMTDEITPRDKYCIQD
ncbi:hypothetical protein PIB30_059914 [Stylosanthes scabra]|uniref:Uncharacterized protein n=1 Tax=Stylosanthes scabra TaxID=79078 RepID=A0ABU6SKE5_9FABA|nr:hypothetical protein [Stylosanthes scabra]